MRDSSTRKQRDGTVRRDYYYNCRRRRNRENRAIVRCTNKGISHKTLVDNLMELSKNMKHTRFSEEDLIKEDIALNKKIKAVNKLIEESESIKLGIDKEIEQINKRIKNLFLTLSSGVSDDIQKMTHEEMERLKNEKKELENKKIEYSSIELESKKQYYRDRYDYIIKLSEQETYTFDEVLEQIYEIKILDDTRVTVSFKVPTLQLEDDEAQRLAHYLFTK